MNYNKLKRGQFKSFAPHIDSGWEIDLKRSASFGLVQSKLTKIATELGYTTKYTLHSFRGGAPTCASQLDFPREERERLGHWAPGRIMPARYDKAVCATEPKLRDKIFPKIRPGRRPQHAFQVRAPEGKADKHNTVESESDYDTSVTSTAPHVKEERINDIINLNGD